jgi:hypothetical protein
MRLQILHEETLVLKRRRTLWKKVENVLLLGWWIQVIRERLGIRNSSQKSVWHGRAYPCTLRPSLWLFESTGASNHSRPQISQKTQRDLDHRQHVAPFHRRYKESLSKAATSESSRPSRSSFQTRPSSPSGSTSHTNERSQKPSSFN